jgi:phosphatidylglycerol:prolipoprotein diacylglycerol transferase
VKPTLFALHLAGRAVDIHAYGFMVAVGAILGVILAVQLGRRAGLASSALLDLCFWSLIAGLAGSRLLYVIVHAKDYSNLCFSPVGPRSTAQALSDCAAPLAIWRGGLVFYGGALAAAGVLWFFCRKHRWNIGQVADVLAPGLALGHVFGRLGCLLVGCCYGKLCSFGLHFPPASVAYSELAARGLVATGAATTPGLAPTQLFEALGEAVIFAVLMILRRKPRFPGALVLIYVMTYALLRFAIEIFRGDNARGNLFDLTWPALASRLGLPPEQPLALSTAQTLSLVLGVLAATTCWWLRHRASTLAARMR